MIELLQENSLLLLFVVTALGYAVGQIRLWGLRLGSAAVLFVGLFFGALDPALQLPLFVVQLGLVIFVYAIGLSNGANFFQAFREQGSQQLSFIIFFLTLPALAVLPFFLQFDLTATTVAGLFAGVGTNTAALAGVLDSINATEPSALTTNLAAATAVAFAISYPIAVLGRIVTITFFQRLWRVDYAAEAEAVRQRYPGTQEIVNQAITITQPSATGVTLRQLQRMHGWDVLFGRLWRDNRMTLLEAEGQFQLDDVIFIAGEAEKVAHVVETLGQPADDALFADYSVYLKRYFFVSNPDIVGQSIAALDLKEQFGAMSIQLRRGDTRLLATRQTILEFGDRIEVLARRSEMPNLTALFGDSYSAVSQVNLLSFGFGITFGLLLGMVSLTLPGGITFQIGFASGTLIVALILGALRRTGSIVWTLPYSANQTLQQIGLILLLASIGVRSGSALENLVLGNTVLLLIGMATFIVILTTTSALVIGHKLLKYPFALVAGMVSSQPAVFSYVSEQANNHLPTIGFTMSVPLSFIFKVAYAQLLYLLLR